MIAYFKSNFWNINKHILVTALSIFMMSGTMVNAQEEVQATKLKSKIKLIYNKYSDNSKILTANLTAKIDKKNRPVVGVPVNLYTVSDTSNNLVSTVNTNEEGQAFFKIPSLEVDTSGAATFLVKYDGNDKYKSAKKETTVKDVRFDLKLSIEDSVKTATVTAYEIKGDGSEVPLNEMDINLSVTRLFSKLKVAEGWMVGGTTVIEFPSDIPGDTLGNLTIVAMIVDNEIYGNVEKQESIDWGVAYEIPPFKDPDVIFGAPGWAIFILYTVLLLAIAHTLYAVFNFFFLIKNYYKKS